MKALSALAIAAVLLTACEKEEDPPAPVPYVKSWDLWTIPHDTASMVITVNGDTIPVTHSYYFQPAMIPADLRDEATYYVGLYKVYPNDVVRVTGNGYHQIHLTTVHVASMSGTPVEFTVYPSGE